MTWLVILRRVLDILAGLIADMRADRIRKAAKAEVEAKLDREVADGLEKIAHARADAARRDDAVAGGLHDDDGFRRE